MQSKIEHESNFVRKKKKKKPQTQIPPKHQNVNQHCLRYWDSKGFIFMFFQNFTVNT